MFSSLIGWLNPGRFERVGRGIERRAGALGQHWEPHFARSRRAQAEWAAGLPRADTLLVLGAGRLHDFDHDAFADRFRRMILLDADPTCLPRWEKLRDSLRGRCGVEFVTRDVSGCLDDWERDFGNALKRDWEQTLDMLRKTPAPPQATLEAADAILSLNLLSQIPIMWQDAVEDILRRRFSQRFVEKHEEQWLLALHRSAQSLVRQHLAALAASGASDILLITDLEYRYYYESPERGRAETHNSLHDVDPSAISGYRLVSTTEWEWHISPLGAENRRYGTIHRVGAFQFRQEPGGLKSAAG